MTIDRVFGRYFQIFIVAGNHLKSGAKRSSADFAEIIFRQAFLNFMKKAFLLFCGVVLFALASFGAAQAQENNNVFDEKDVEYTFTFPDEKWKPVAKAGDARSTSEFIYGDRLDGLLQIKLAKLEEKDLLSDVVERETTQKLQFLPGYVPGKQDVFNGSLKGRVFNYEFVQAGKNMSGRIYFLNSDAGGVYVLRFTAYRDKLRLLRVQTDSIARTFKIKEVKKEAKPQN